MASGIASPWGLTPQMVAGMTNSLDAGTHHLTGEQSLTSYPPVNNVSPLTIQNRSLYTAPNFMGFGKKRSLLQKVNADIRFLQKL